jgi:Na+:H+ antiporter, NhaA family
MTTHKKAIVEKFVFDPINRFISNSSSSGIVLFSSALLALILANSPIAEQYQHFWETKFTIGFDKYILSKDLHHWINDGLMAVFFFVVGLELKREIVAGELSNPKNAILPLAAAVGGMVFPALIYLLFNPTGEASNGWGVPMATDIAFALGVLYLLGDKVPFSVKLFLTALAIADDLGAVLVIAFFYTSNIDFTSLLIGAIFLTVLIAGNLAGIRSAVFYGVIGIGGLWLAFLLSGVHATIAAVLAAFTIPANVKISEKLFSEKTEKLLHEFKSSKPNDKSTVTEEQYYLLDKVRRLSDHALTPLQKLEHLLHPLVAFIIMPIFALSNANVTFSENTSELLLQPVTIGIFLGLLAGKVIGVSGVVILLVKLKIAKLPTGMNKLHITGLSFLAAIGFTMSLFVTELAFKDPDLITEAKIAVLLASVIASIIGYLLIKKANQNNTTNELLPD